MESTRERIRQLYSGPLCDVYEGSGGVALKVVDEDFVRKPHDFRTEIRLLKQMNHENVTLYIDDYTVGEDHVLVMPLYGVDLRGVMEHFKKKKVRFNLQNPLKNKTVEMNMIPEELLKPMIQGIAAGLRYLHEEQHVIHRDIKPGNIMFRSLAELSHPVLIDFGIAYPNFPVAEKPDQKYIDIATGYYKPPELCFGVTDYGPEVDLWSFGILMTYLYSEDGKPANYAKEDDDSEAAPELNDFVLLKGTFGSFGTPTISDVNSELYWPRMADEKLHFRNFEYKQHPRRPVEELLPRCRDGDVRRWFALVSRYDGRVLPHDTCDT